jgi:FtsP/CotA-like multicopper oxidase with cupredoxin domain
MRFGVFGMGSETHTFDLHGHRWIVPGPSGTDPTTIQNSTQNHPVSQFEDTRLLGPANSLAFTIDGRAGSFMRAGGRNPDDSVGEWHMHCHVLHHIMEGMMGSLLIVGCGEFAFTLRAGVPCPQTSTGLVEGRRGASRAPSSPQNLMVSVGRTVTWNWDESDEHSVTADPPETWDSGKHSSFTPPFPTFTHTFTTPGTFPYHCQVPGGPGGIGMSGTITVM